MKKKVMLLKGQTQLSFTSQPEQEPATVIAKDDATTTAQAKSKERKFFELWLKKYSWLGYEKNGNYMYCRVSTETWKSNGMRKETQPKFSKHHAHSTCWSRRTQGGFPRS